VASKPIQAAGGIVVRDGARALVAVVQRSKDDAWVLPRGKLKRDENPVTGARREVIEETGHRVRVHEFLGAITYRASGRPKVVQFWRMQADAEASHELMADIAAVEWLSLSAAVRRLSYPLEKLFLRNVGRQALRSRDSAAAKPRRKKHKKASRKSAPKSKTASTKAPNRKTKATGVRAHARRKLTAKHVAPKRVAPAASTNAQTERAIAAIAAVAAKPITAAKRKSILQRMLGRLAG
jgi:8-oxo-dGTP pyrophosphatase MutT (NUDIX family)